MAKQIHCVNCFLFLRCLKNIKLGEETPEVQNLVATWIHPMQISENDKICVECRNLAIEALEDPEKALVENWPPRGHKRICIMCGRSTLRVYAYPAVRESLPLDEQLRYARIVAVKIAPRKLKPYHEICKPCYRKILRKHPRARPTPIKEHYVSAEDHVGEPPEVQVIKIEQFDPLRDFRVPNINPIVKAEEESDDEHNVTVDTSLNDPKKIKKEIDTDFTSQQRDIIAEIYDVSKAHLLTEESVNAYTAAIKEESSNAFTAILKEKEKPFDITTEDETEKYEQPVEEDKAQELEQETQVDQLDRITLPTIRRSVMTSKRCVFDDCVGTKLMPIPDHIRIQILSNFRYFIPKRARICIKHLKSNSFHELCTSPKNYDSFTSEQIQDMVLLPLRKPFAVIPNFDVVEENEDDLIEYWTGVDKEMFVKILSITKLDKVRRGGTGLAALLCKLRTEDSNEKLSKVFGLNRKTLDKVILKAKQGMAKHPKCIDIVCSQMTNNKRRLFENYIKRRPKLGNGERKAMQQKKISDRNQLLTKSVSEHARLEVPISSQCSVNSPSSVVMQTSDLARTNQKDQEYQTDITG